MEGDRVHLDVDVRTEANDSPSHPRGQFHMTTTARTNGRWPISKATSPA
ncbi:hypothetical protein ACFVHB_17580 [Kitasatospora sp. NPDC127111]